MYCFEVFGDESSSESKDTLDCGLSILTMGFLYDKQKGCPNYLSGRTGSGLSLVQGHAKAAGQPADLEGVVDSYFMHKVQRE